jgi:hypothetical protein
MQIKVITQDPEVLQVLVAGNAPGSFVAVCDGVRLKYEHTLSLRGFSAAPYTAQMVTFVLEHCDAIATSLLAAWLYDKLKGRKAELHVGKDDDVTISSVAIRQALMKEKKE